LRRGGMPLRPIDFWERVARFHRRVNEMFDSMLGALEPANVLDLPLAAAPPVAVYRQPEAFVVVIALPGAIPEDVDLALEDERELVVRGRVEPPVAGEVLLDEHRFGRFERRVRLPEPVPVEPTPEAELRDGLLVVRLRRKEATS